MLNKVSMTSKEVEALYQRHLNPVAASIFKFIGTNRVFNKASGIFVWDEQGKQYMDFLSGFGSVNLGHEPPEVVSALKNVEGLPNFLQAAINPYAAHLAQQLSDRAPGNLSRSFFCNSGTEAVEAAIKLARCASRKSILVSTENAYHGKTMGALSVSGKEKYKKPFFPLVPDTITVRYNDIDDLERVLSHGNAAAFIVEPIQGEAGVIVPSPGYLKAAEQLCRKYKTLMIIDEIQTGMGRTGKLFCCEYEKVEPDIICLSKSLGGGVMPIGAILTSDKLWKKAYGDLLTGFLHSSTFGGNTRACACGIAALQAIDEQLLTNAVEHGDYLLNGLRSLQNRFQVIKDVRGKGLMIGIQLAKCKGNSPILEGALTLWIVRQLFLKQGIITAFTLNNYDVLRIMPPLNVTRQHMDEFLRALERVLKQCEIVSRFGVLQKV